MIPAINAENVTVRYGRRVAVDGVTLSVPRWLRRRAGYCAKLVWRS